MNDITSERSECSQILMDNLIFIEVACSVVEYSMQQVMREKRKGKILDSIRKSRWLYKIRYFFGMKCELLLH